MRTFDATQQALVDSASKEITWLFTVSYSGGTYYWSTKEYTYDLQAYTFKVMPELFRGVTLNRNLLNPGQIAPNTLEFSVTDEAGALSASSFVDYPVRLDLLYTVGVTTAIIRTWKFTTVRCEASEYKLAFFCEDIVQGLLKEKTYPNLPTYHEIALDDDTFVPNDNLCVPLCFGDYTLCMPSLRHIALNNGVSTQRYYILGKWDGANTYDLPYCCNPNNLGKTSSYIAITTENESYWENLYDGEDYSIAQPYVKSIVEGGAYAAQGWWTDGQGHYLDVPFAMDWAATQAYVHVDDILEYILEDFGAASADIDTGVGSSFETAMTTVHDVWGLHWGGSIFAKITRELLLHRLLASCHCCLDVTDKIELRVLSKTSVKTITTADVTGGDQTSFSYSPILENLADSAWVQGKIRYSPTYPTPEALLTRMQVTVKSTYDSPSHDEVIFPFFCTPAVFDRDDNFTFTKKLGTLYFQRVLNRLASGQLTLKTKCAGLDPDDVITINDARYGGNYDVFIEGLTFNHDGSIDVRFVRPKEALDDWADIVPATTTVNTDPATSDSIWSPVVCGPDSYDGSTYKGNVLAGKLRIGETGNFILFDPSEPIIRMAEGGVTRVEIGDLGTDDYGFRLKDHSGNVIMLLDGSGTNTLAGWDISSSTISKNNAILDSAGALTLGTVNDIVKLSAVDAIYRIWAGHADAATAPFSVSATGALKSTSGLIAGFTIDGTEGLYAGAAATRVQMKPGAGFWAGATAIGDAPFSVTNAGALKSTSGEIAGWTVSATSISKDNLTLDSETPSIRLGAATAYMTGIGQWEGKDVDDTYKWRVGDPSGKYIRWTGSQLEINDVIVSAGDIAGTVSDSFEINSDLNDVDVELIFGRTTGGNATITWNGTYLEIDKDAYFSSGDLFVGINDYQYGTISVYGHTSGAQGGVVDFYLGGEHDATISYFRVQAYEDDLLIGPSTDTDALKLSADKDLYITAGTINISDLTASRLTASDASKNIVSVTDLTAWVGGTAGQITSTSDGDGTLTLAISNGTAINQVLLTGADPFTPAWTGVYTLSHDSFADFVADEHVAHSGVTLTAGDGLTGGGTIAASRTFALGLPGTLSSGSIDGVSADSHTHAITNYALTGTVNQITVTGAGKVLGAAVTLSLPADVLIPTVLTVPNTGLHILDTNGTHDLIIAAGSDLTADHTLTFTTGDADRTVTLNSSVTIGALGIGALLVASAANTIEDLAVGLTTQILVGGGAGTVPSWGTDLPAGVTIGSKYIYRADGNDVPVADGGTGASTLTDHGVLLGSGTAAITPMAVGGTGALIKGVAASDPVWSTLVLTEGANTFNLTLGTAVLDIAAGATLDVNANLTVESASYINQDVTSDASPIWVTVKLSGLTDGYVPYHVADATGLADSPIYISGSDVGIGVNPSCNLHIYDASSHAKVFVETASDSAYSILQLQNSSDGTYATFSLNPDGLLQINNSSSAAAGQLIITSTGNVGIGTTGPGAALHVVKTGAGLQNLLYIDNEQAVAAGVGSSIFFTGSSSDNSIAAIKGAWTGATTDAGGYLTFHTRLSDVAGATEKMRIDKNGNVGIGTTSPAFGIGSGLEIQRSGAATLRVSNADTIVAELRADTDALRLQGRTAHSLILGTSGYDYLTILTSGVVRADRGGQSLYINPNYGNTDVWSAIQSDTGMQLRLTTGDSATASNGITIDTGNVGIGTTGPDAKLDVLTTSGAQLRLTYTDGTVYSDFTVGSGGNLTVAPTGDFLIGTDVDLSTANYVSQTTGWGITYTGNADFRYIFADELHVKAFIADIYSALAGGLIISKSRARVSRDFTIPNTAATATLYVEDLEGWPDTAVFEANDYVCLRVIDTSGGGLVVTDVYGQVTAYADDLGGEQHWTFTTTTPAYAAGDVIYRGSIALDYGAVGDGLWEATVLDAAGAPYSQVRTFGAITDGEPATWTTWVRLGNLDGLAGVGAEHGLYAGQGLTDSDAYVLITDQQVALHNLPLEIHDGTARRIYLDPTVPSIAVGAAAPTDYLTGDGFWVGNDSGTYKLHLGDVDGERLIWDGTDIYLYSSANDYLWFDAGTGILGYSNGVLGLQLLSTGQIIVGEVAASKSNIAITSNAVQLRTNTTVMAELTTAGQLILGDDAAGGEYVTIDTTNGIRQYAGGTLYVQLTNGGVLTLGNTSAEYVKVSSSGFQVYDGATLLATYAASTTFYDTAGADRLVLGTTGITVGDSTEGEYITIDSTNGIRIYGTGTIVGQWTNAGIAYIGDQSNEHIKLSSSGFQVYDGAVLYATYGATTTIGLTASEHISISGTSVQIMDGATIYTDLTGGVLTLGATTDNVVIDSTGMTVKSNSVTRLTALDTGVTAYGDNATTYTSITSAGLSIVDNSVTAATFTSSAITLNGASTADQVVINNTGMTVTSNSVTRLTALDTGVTIYGDNATTYASITSAGLTIVDNSITLANFGSTVTVGQVAAEKNNVYIDANGLYLRTNTDAFITLTHDGIPTISLPSGGAINVAAGGDIVLSPDDSDPATITFTNAGSDIYIGCKASEDALFFWPETEDDGTIIFGKSPSDAWQPFDYFRVYTDIDILLYVSEPGTAVGQFYIALSEGGGNLSSRWSLDYGLETEIYLYGTAADSYITFKTSDTERARIDKDGNVTLSQIAACGSDVDKFLVSNSGVIQYRTGAQVLSDIGGFAVAGGTFSGDVTFTNTGLHILDTNGTHDLIIKPGSDLSADRILTITTGDAARTFTIGGDLSVESTSLINQDVTSDASPTFTTVKLSNLTDGYIPYHIADATGLGNSQLYAPGYILFLGDTANAKMTVGITLNQAAAADEIFATKATGVNHLCTNEAETDTYFLLKKDSSDGAKMMGFSAAYTGFHIVGAGTTIDNTTGTGALGCIMLDGADIASNALQAMAVGDPNLNLLCVRDNTLTRFIVKADGDIYYDGADQGAYDDYDDIQACIDLERALTGKDEKDNKLKHKDLEDMGLFTSAYDDEGKKHIFVSTKKKSKLQLGAIAQLQAKIAELQTQIEQLRGN